MECEGKQGTFTKSGQAGDPSGPNVQGPSEVIMEAESEQST